MRFHPAGGIPPVHFTADFDNVKTQVFLDSIIGYGNMAVIGSQGEGAAREIFPLKQMLADSIYMSLSWTHEM